MRSNFSVRKHLLTPVLALTALFMLAPHAALAAAPTLDKGTQPDLSNFYANVQSATGNVSVDHAIYGKLEGTTPIDVFTFTPDTTTTSTQLNLYIRKDEVTPSTNPYLVLIDPTTNTTAQQLGVPLPSSDYHATVISQVSLTEGRTYTEPAIMETYQVVAQQSVAFTAGKKYYLIVLDSDSTGKHITHYAIGFGTGKAWTTSDIFKSFGSWWRLRVDSYGASSPFHFGAEAIGYFMLLLGILALGGAWLLYHLFNLLSTRSKSAAYLFVKLQNFLPISMWVGLWLVAIGGYMYFVRIGWAGLPFLITVLFVPLLAAILVDTLVLSPQVKKSEVSRKEADIPLLLRKKLFVAFVVEFIIMVAFLVFLAMQVAGL